MNAPPSSWFFKIPRPNISVRVGILFAITSTMVLGCAYWTTHLDIAASDSAAPLSLVWITALASLCFSGLVAMRTTRASRIIEEELMRVGQGDEPSPARARLILADDGVSRGWNALLEHLDESMVSPSNGRPAPSTGPHQGGLNDGSAPANQRSGDRGLANETVAMIRAMRDFPVPWVITDNEGLIQFLSPVAANLIGVDSTPNESAADGDDHADGRSRDGEASRNEDLTPVEDSHVLVALGLIGGSEPESAEASKLRRELLSPARLVRCRWLRTDAAGETSHLQIVRSRLEGRRGENRIADSDAMVWVINDVTQQQIASASRDQFLMSAAHELRTPLQNLHAAAETLGQTDDLSDDERKEFCNLLVSESVRLGSLIDQLLAVGQMESGSMTIHRYPLDLIEMIGDAENQIRAAATEKSIDLSVELPAKLPRVEGDRGKLQAALGNLIGNAVKYTPSGGNVSVICTVADETIQIAVQDSGVGISEADQSRVFEKFYRVSGADTIDGKTVSGNGLGLAFARQVAQLHGGDISLRSELEQGSTFELTLPVDEGPRSGGHSTDRPRSHGSESTERGDA